MKSALRFPGRKIWSGFAILIAVLLVLSSAGCGTSGGTTQAKTNQSIPVVIVGSSWYGHAPAWVGIEKGFFKAAGFDATWKSVPVSADRISALSSNSAQFASAGEIAMFTSMAQGNHDFYWVGSQDQAPGQEGLLASKNIKTFQDLKGKKVAATFGMSFHITAYLLLKDHGLNPDKDVTWLNMSPDQMVTALANGQVDAIADMEPYLSRAMASTPGSHFLGKDTDVVTYQKFKSMTGPDVLLLSKKFVDDNPTAAKRFMKVYFDSVKWVKDHPDETAQVIQKYSQQDIQTIKDGLPHFLWYNLSQQQDVLSDSGLYGQGEFVLDFLQNVVKAIPSKPNYKQWVRLDLLQP